MRLALLAAFLFALASPAPVRAGSVFVTLDTGLTCFKSGYELDDIGFPKLAHPKFDVEPGFEFAPAWMERRGIWLRASFRFQSLGGAAAKWPYVDGPRLGVRFRWRITQ
jgi:hypothetical protein